MNPQTSGPALRTPAEDFDPWFVMLSAPPRSGTTAQEFQVVAADLPVVEKTVDLPGLVTGAARNARRHIRERWTHIRSGTPAEQVAAVLTGKRYRAGRAVDVPTSLATTVSAALAAGRPVEFVLPSFPFKIPNAAKVEHRVPDYAELLCLQRLYEIVEVVRELTDAEARFHIVSDGAIYSDLCGVKYSEYSTYYAMVADFIAGMGAARELHLVDMVADVIGDRSASFERERRELAPMLRSWWDERRHDDRVRYLIRNMAGNIDLGPETTALTRASVYGGGFMSEDGAAQVSQASEEFVKHVHARAEEAAFDFTLLLTTLRRTDMLTRRHPHAIRATVHPKPGQWGIHLVNQESRTFPWQGVALRTAKGTWRVLPQTEAVERAALLVLDATTKQPLYFDERAEHRDVGV